MKILVSITIGFSPSDYRCTRFFRDKNVGRYRFTSASFNDDATAADLFEATKQWIEAARNTDGGKNIDVAIRFPIATGPDGQVATFRFVTVFPYVRRDGRSSVMLTRVRRLRPSIKNS